MVTSSSQLEKIRHSAAHILAMAVLRLYPDAKLGIGIAIENGFFQDFEFTNPISHEEIAEIEEEMHNIIREKLPFTQIFLPREIAINTLLQRGQIYKAELLQDVEEEEVSFYQTGPDFLDLCRGPHITNVDEIKAFKLNTLSGAYWKGDESRPQLQRISGTAFRTNEELDQYFKREELLRNLDFRRIGKELDYFTMHGKQLLMTDAGEYIYRNLVFKLEHEVEGSGYLPINIPIIREDFDERLNDIFLIRNRSYRELPLRWYNTSLLIPKNGVPAGDKTLSMGHQLVITNIAKETEYDVELRDHIATLINIYKSLQLNFDISIHSPDIENDFINTISAFLEKSMISHTKIVDQNKKNVSVEVVATDQYERKWLVGETNIAYPTNNHYNSREGELVPAINIISTITIEVLLAYLLEDKQGMLPFWLSPRKSTIVPISDKFVDYANQVKEILNSISIDANVDSRSEKMEAKIRDAEVKRIPLIIIIGEKERSNAAVSVRLRGNNEIGMIKLEEIQDLVEKID